MRQKLVHTGFTGLKGWVEIKQALTTLQVCWFEQQSGLWPRPDPPNNMICHQSGTFSCFVQPVFITFVEAFWSMPSLPTWFQPLNCFLVNLFLNDNFIAAVSVINQKFLVKLSLLYNTFKKNNSYYDTDTVKIHFHNMQFKKVLPK